MKDMAVARAVRALPFLSRLALLKAARAMSAKTTKSRGGQKLARRFHLEELVKLSREFLAQGYVVSWDGTEIRVQSEVVAP